MPTPTPVLYIHGGNTYETYDAFMRDLLQKQVTLERLRPMIDWKARFPEVLGADYDVLAPRMPNGTNAQYDEWCTYFERILEVLPHGTICIGHSLGGIFLVKYLAEHALPLPLRATLLVAAPYTDTPEESLASFTRPESLAGFTRQAGMVHIYHSTDDPVVPFSDGEAYAQALPHAVFHPVKGYGHFNVEDFPEIVSDIRTLADRRTTAPEPVAP